MVRLTYGLKYNITSSWQKFCNNFNCDVDFWTYFNIIRRQDSENYVFKNVQVCISMCVIITFFMITCKRLELDPHSTNPPKPRKKPDTRFHQNLMKAWFRNVTELGIISITIG